MSEAVNDSEEYASLPPHVTRLVGVPRPEVDSWGITQKRRDGNGFVRCEHSDGNGGRVRTWPLSELTRENIHERWGPGRYRVCWFQGQSTKGGGIEFGIEEVAVSMPQQPSQPAEPRSSSLGPLRETFELMAMLDARSNTALERTLTAAAAMGRNSGGLDGQTLLLVMNQSQQSARDMLQTMQIQHAEQMNLLRAELRAMSEDEDEDEGSSAVATAAAAVAKPFFKKNQDFMTSVKNYAAENPGDLFEVLKGIPGALSQLGQLMKQQNAAPAQQVIVTPAPPEPRPRARIATQERPPPTGINSMFQTPPVPPVQAVEAPAPVAVASPPVPPVVVEATSADKAAE